MTTTLDHPIAPTAPTTVAAPAAATTDTPQTQPRKTLLPGDVAFLATPVMGICCALAIREFGVCPAGVAALTVWLLIIALADFTRELS